MLAAVERRDLEGQERPLYEVRALVRWHLGTPYPQVVLDVMRLLCDSRLKSPLLVVDQTGVGMAVVDQFRAREAPMIAVTITGGELPGGQGADGAWRVPKKDLAGGLQVLLANRELIIPKTLPGADVLAKELQDFRVKVDAKTANETWEAAGSKHDDIVLALALAVWAAERSCGAMPWRMPDEARSEIGKAPPGVFWS